MINLTEEELCVEVLGAVVIFLDSTVEERNPSPQEIQEILESKRGVKASIEEIQAAFQAASKALVQ